MRPGEIILDRACFSFVTGLEAVGAEIDKTTLAEPPRAVALYETFLAGCHAKADQLNQMGPGSQAWLLALNLRGALSI
jgi:hypothetical protein